MATKVMDRISMVLVGKEEIHISLIVMVLVIIL